MRPPFSYVPTLPALVGIIAGIVVYRCTGTQYAAVVAVAGIGCSVAAAAWLYAVKRHYFAFMSLFVAVGLLMSLAHKSPDVPRWIYDGEHRFVAKIERVDAHPLSTVCRVVIHDVDSIHCQPIPALLTVRTVASIAPAGADISFRGTLVSIADEAPPLVPHDVDYHQFLASEGIYSYITVDMVREVSPPGAFQTYVNQLRDAIYRAIVFSPVDGQTSAFLLAVILGEDAYLLPSQYGSYRSVGVAHVLALSGLHVGILVSLMMFLLFPLTGVSRGRALRSVLTLITVWLYVFIVGFAPSILRAAVMVTVFVLASHLQRGYFTFNSLSLAVIVMLCICPAWIASPGMQLSVAAVASILMFGNLLPDELKRHRVLYYLANAVIIPVAAMLGTGIVSAYYFHTFAGMFLLGNIVVGLLFPWILMGGVLLAIFTSLSVSFSLMGSCVTWLYHCMDAAVSVMASWRWSVVDGIFFSPWVMLPYAMMLVALAWWLRGRDARYGFIALALLSATVLTAALKREAVPEAELYTGGASRDRHIILRSGEDAWLYIVDDADVDDVLSVYNERYAAYLRSRGCADFVQAPFSISTPSLYVYGDEIVVGAVSLVIVRGDSVRVGHSRRHDYALLTAGYRGGVAGLLDKVDADTVVFAPSMRPSRRKRLMRLCGDSIPYIDLRRRGISVEVWAK